MKVRLLALILATATSASGRIGETIEECKVRYGDPLKVEGSHYTFSKNKMQIVVSFHLGIADSISYTGDIQPQVAIQLSRLNSRGVEWVENKAPDLKKDMAHLKTSIEDENQLFAGYDSPKTLVIVTMASIRRLAQKRGEEDKKSIEGL